MSVSVMAHPVRSDLVDELLMTLDRPATVVWARNPEPSMAPEARWRTGREAWLAHDEAATHHLVIQDDAVVCRDLVAGIELALKSQPEAADTVCSFYYGNHRGVHRPVDAHAEEAERTGASWVVSRAVRQGLALVMPTATIPGMVGYADIFPGIPYDAKVGRFWRKVMERPCWNAWPSLTDHRQVPSLVGHSDGRKARRFLGADTSATSVDWSRPPVGGKDVA